MPPTLGQRLKQAREARGLSVADVTHVTRIPAQRLRDLEEDRYTGSGSLTYAKSFLSGYANFLNVDATSVLNHIQPPPLGGVGDYRYLVENYGHWVDDDSNSPSMAPSQPIVPAPRSIGFAALICSVVALFGLGVWYVIGGTSLLAHNAASAKTSEPVIPRAEVIVDQTTPLNAAVDDKDIVVQRAHAANGTGALPSQLAVEEDEFTVGGVEITSDGDLIVKPVSTAPIPKAIPVP